MAARSSPSVNRALAEHHDDVPRRPPDARVGRRSGPQAGREPDDLDGVARLVGGLIGIGHDDQLRAGRCRRDEIVGEPLGGRLVARRHDRHGGRDRLGESRRDRSAAAVANAPALDQVGSARRLELVAAGAIDDLPAGRLDLSLEPVGLGPVTFRPGRRPRSRQVADLGRGIGAHRPKASSEPPAAPPARVGRVVPEVGRRWPTARPVAARGSCRSRSGTGIRRGGRPSWHP